MRALTDAELVEAARGGDKSAFAALLTRHRPLLLALCRRYLGEAGPAEDAAQEAALQALLCLDGLRRADRFGPWLAGIGLNVCRRWLRQRKHDGQSWEALVGGRALPEPVDTGAPESLAEAADLAARVRRAVDGLPVGQRAVVLLFYLAGLTHAETAAALGVGVGAVKTRLHKARRTLRERLRTLWMEETMTTEATTQPVEMRVTDVLRNMNADDGATRHVVVLEEVGGDRVLHVWVGEAEAMAILEELEGIEYPRPQTFAFAARLVEATETTVREARITRLVDDVFYATVTLETPAGERAVDARPSDALNLALRAGAAIRVDADVVNAATLRAPEPGPGTGTAARAELAAEVRARIAAHRP